MVLAAYTAEVVRAGIEAIPRGQFEAAQALGLPFIIVLRKVVLPQALRIVIPPTTSNFILAIKETSLASTVATPDLLKNGARLAALNANPTPLLGGAALSTLLWHWCGSSAFWRSERARSTKDSHFDAVVSSSSPR